MPDIRWLDEREAAAWQAVRTLGQPLWTALGRDLQRDSGLSMADYQVLVVLSSEPAGTLSYPDLASATGWEKSRLSHHITRMERRELVRRIDCATDGRSADVALTPQGMAAIARAAPGHVAAVRRLLVDNLSPEQVDVLAAIGRAVTAALGADAASAGGGPVAGPDRCPAAGPG